LRPARFQHPGGRQAARFARSGFTMIELVMAVLLVGLLLGAVTVAAAFSLRNTEQLKGEARSLAGFLEQVRTRSAETGRRYTVEYALDEYEQKYFAWAPGEVEPGQVYEGEGDEMRKAVGYHEMPSRRRGDGGYVYVVWIDRIGFGDGSSTSDEQVKIDFMPTGGGHWHMVYLRNEDDEFYTVVVNPFTGAAEVYPGEYEPPEPRRMR
jgi:prepilin-type N-terminal cleavage/methylation domain-containing protein